MDQGDIEALLEDAASSGDPQVPFEASRRDFVRLLVRTAERIDLDAAHRNRAPVNPEGALWRLLDGLVSAARVFRDDPLTDRMEPRLEYRFGCLEEHL